MPYTLPHLDEYVDAIRASGIKRSSSEKIKGLNLMEREFYGKSLTDVAVSDVVALRDSLVKPNGRYTRKTIVVYFNAISTFVEWCNERGYIKSHNWDRNKYKEMGDSSPFKYEVAKERKEPMVKVTMPVVEQGIAQTSTQEVVSKKSTEDVINEISEEDAHLKEELKKAYPNGCKYKHHKDIAFAVYSVSEGLNMPTEERRVRILRASLEECGTITDRSPMWWSVKSIAEFHDIPLDKFKDYGMHKPYKAVDAAKGTEYDAYSVYKIRAKRLITEKLQKDPAVLEAAAEYMGVPESCFKSMYEKGCLYQGRRSMARFFDMPAIRSSDVQVPESFEFLRCIQMLINEARRRYSARFGEDIPLRSDVQICDIKRGSGVIESALEQLECVKPTIGEALHDALKEGLTKWKEPGKITAADTRSFQTKAMRAMKAVSINAHDTSCKIQTCSLDDLIAYFNENAPIFSNAQRMRDFIESSPDLKLKDVLMERLLEYLAGRPVPAMRIDNVESRF